MKKIKTISAIGLAVILMAIVTAVSACARTQDPVSFAVDYAEGILWVYSHPREAVNVSSAVLSRDNDNNISELIKSSEGAQKYVRYVNFFNLAGISMKTGWETVNPNNVNSTKMIVMKVEKPLQYPTDSGVKSGLEYNVFGIPLFSKNTITFDPLLAYKTKDHQLVVLALMKNYSNHNVEISGMPEVQLHLDDGQQIAAGQTSGFGAPIKLSYYQKKASTGVYNGMPNAIFVVMTFEPGTYDPNVDITSLDNLSCNYSLDYTYLN